VKRACLAAALACGLLAASAPAAAIDGLHDARYCEIIELKGSPPDAHAVVWNTIGLNDCPREEWEKLDTAVVLNGPRHFLMDSAAAKTGGVRSFHGMRMTKVATIPIETAADLLRTPYTDRTIARSNSWRWKRGRTVFELVAPGGDVYVMQSYSQILDPSLAHSDLPKLGRRLELPDGWRYRSRKLRRPLELVAKGKATILQDELQNTYQLAATPRRPDGRRAQHGVDLSGTTRTVDDPPPGMVEDHGTISGDPFGDGTLVLVGTFHDGVLDGTVRLLFPDGSVIASVHLPYTITGDEIDFAGTGRFSGGTGAYRGITSGELEVLDHNKLDGQSGVLSVKGRAKY
jgi:hypothetical protein